MSACYFKLLFCKCRAISVMSIILSISVKIREVEGIDEFKKALRDDIFLDACFIYFIYLYSIIYINASFLRV